MQKNNGAAFDFYGLIEATVSGGYKSDSLSDGTTYTFSLCENCLDELFNQFKVPVDETCW